MGKELDVVDLECVGDALTYVLSPNLVDIWT